MGRSPATLGRSLTATKRTCPDLLAADRRWLLEQLGQDAAELSDHELAVMALAGQAVDDPAEEPDLSSFSDGEPIVAAGCWRALTLFWWPSHSRMGPMSSHARRWGDELDIPVEHPPFSQSALNVSSRVRLRWHDHPGDAACPSTHRQPAGGAAACLRPDPAPGCRCRCLIKAQILEAGAPLR